MIKNFSIAAISLAIAEDKPGLRIGTDSRSIQLIEHRDAHAIFFLSSNLKPVFGDNCPFKPAWHDVIQIDEKI